jgi:hypothetical protein
VITTRILARSGVDGSGRQRHRVLADWGGRSSSVTAATVLWRANGDVQGLAGVKVSKWVRGERERKCEATGRAGVLARP